MKYKIYINYRDWEIIAETFEFEKLNKGIYAQKRRLGFLREAWDGDIPIYLNNDDIFIADYLKEISKNVVTPEPIFCIFDKENLTFKEMIQEIWKRRDEIITPVKADDNPYEKVSE